MKTLEELKSKATASELLLIDKVLEFAGDAVTEDDRKAAAKKGEIEAWESVQTLMNELASRTGGMMLRSSHDLACTLRDELARKIQQLKSE